MATKGKTGVWGHPEFLHDLVMCFYAAGTEAGVMTAEVRKDIEVRMKTMNHQVTWEAISPYYPAEMGRQVMRWDEKVHQDILLAVFQHVKFLPDQMGSIMSDLTGIGYTFSESALRSSSSIMSSHKWDDRSHVGLLLALLDALKPTKDVISAATEHMKAQGFQTTFHGINQHIQKLRREQGFPEKAAAKNGDDTPEPATPATPAKATPRKRKTPTKKAKSAANIEQSDDEGDELPIKHEVEEPLTPKRAKKAKIE
ncbi:hypothetical protein EsDP_00003354 [Epichloe bromicola]|uniref:Uncharacterized protein n=1 Tax=Epichloe bromicola TaxID=79588 RepID=A0ABQ0CNH1_9HYPO